MTARKPLACVTMAYNEADMLPLWLRHYARQAGAENCFVLDHGSDDGSTRDLGGARRIALARSPLDEPVRAAFVADLCARLLAMYQFVAFTDTDELLVADPARWATLTDYVAEPRAAATTAFGLNLLHRMHHEVEWDPARPILAQRSWAFPEGSMCKPSLIRTPVRWDAGFHTSTEPPAFGGLFLFHLAYFDYGIALRRQAKRRSQDIAAGQASHHRASDADVRSWMEGWSAMPTDTTVTLDDDCAASAAFTAALRATVWRGTDGMHHINRSIHLSRLWRIPDRFANAF